MIRPAGLKQFLTVLDLTILITLAFIAYAATFAAPFHFDDRVFILDNLAIKRWLDVGLLWSYNAPRVVTFFTLSFNYRLGGLSVVGYHVVNWLIHLLTALTVYGLVGLLLEREKPGGKNRLWALLAALIFAVHPLQTQAVTYIWQRAAALCALFYLGSLWAYGRGRIKLGPSASVFLALSWLLGLLALFSKQNAYTLPLAIAALELCFFTEKDWKKRLRRFAPFGLFLVLLPLVLATTGSRELTDLQNLGLKRLPPLHYALTEIGVLRTYLRLTFLPFNQTVDYDYPIKSSAMSIFTGALLILGLLTWAIKLRRKHPLVVFGILLFFLGLAVESSLVPLEDVIFEHRMYLPMAGLLIAAVGLLTILKRLNPLFLIVILVPTLIILTTRRNQVWTSELSLWQDAVNKAPGKSRPFNNLGLTYQKQENWSEAAIYLDRSIALNPANLDAQLNRGSVYEKTGNREAAEGRYRLILALNPAYTPAYVNLGILQINNGDRDGARQSFNRALAVNPRNAEAHNNLGHLYALANDNEKALREFRAAVANNPDHADAYYNVGWVYERQEKFNEALAAYERARELDPKDADTWLGIGSVYRKLGLPQRALPAIKEAERLLPRDADIQYTLGRAYFDAGDEVNTRYHLRRAAEFGYPFTKKQLRELRAD